MKRLTSNNPLTESESTNLSLTDLYARLKEYEDAEEQGRLIVLPCKVGDTVYINTPSGVTLCEVVDSITKPELRTRTLGGLRGLDFNFHEFGKSVFLSREEAERALEGMK